VIRWARVRLYVDGRMVDEATTLGEDGLRDIAARHAELAELAEQKGHRYMVEFEFSDGEHVRFGSDRDGMVEPIEVETDIVEQVGRERGWLR
jgi:arabinogalactan endo-1,4-beta-galactosidase